VTDREGALTLNTIGAKVLGAPDIMTDCTFRTLTSRYSRTSRTPCCTSSRPTSAPEYETTVNAQGLPWYKGEVGFDDGLKT
jgi:hypothetical protein